jgi:hypothetical protein
MSAKAAMSKKLPPEMTVETARAAATDAGNRNMRSQNREIWNAEDARVAHREFVRLMPTSAELPTGVKR